MTFAAGFCVLLAVAAAAPDALSGNQEHGHGLTSGEAHAGWISLFDGSTTFGWKEAAVVVGELSGGTTTTRLGEYEMRADVAAGGEMVLGGEVIEVRPGRLERTVAADTAQPIRLGRGVRIRSLVVRPIGLRPLLTAAESFKPIPNPALPADRQAVWHVMNPSGQPLRLRGSGGPGAVEFPQRFGDFVLQVDVQTRRRGSNGGVFFRCIPGQFLNGYEAQVLNRCEDGDPARPVGYTTGALDDRQRARRLVSRDGLSCTMTIVAVGPHVATWVNGHQLTDWTDSRPSHDNPRQGLRTEPGTIQFQCHDARSELEFHSLRAAEIQTR